MTEEDLKRMQDHFLEGGKKILLERNHLHPVGFVITLHKHVEKLFEAGWGVEIIDPASCVRDSQDDRIATLILDLLMDWKRMYHAVLNVFPETKPVLLEVLALGKSINVDDPYKHVMRPFMKVTRLDVKDIMAATMRQICEKVDAFASIFQSEAWMRSIDVTAEMSMEAARAQAPANLAKDALAIETVFSSMETYDFARMVTVPIHRTPSKTRDGGKVLGFGDPTENIDSPGNDHVLEGRLTRFLKPLAVAS